MDKPKAALLGLLLCLAVGNTRAQTGNPDLNGGISFAGGYPLDKVPGVTISGAYGIGSLTAAWPSGHHLFDLVVGGVTTTIDAVGPGYPDVRAIAHAVGASPTNGTGGGTISRLYDQSGNGRDFVQTSATGSARPELWLIDGHVTMQFSGAISAVPQQMTTAIPVDNRSLSIFAAINPFATQPSSSVKNTASGIFGTGTPGAAGDTDIGFFASSAGLAGHAHAATVFAGLTDGTKGAARTVSPYIGIQPQILTGVASATGTSVSQNDTSGAGPALVAATHDKSIFGNLATHAFYGGRVQALIVSSSVFSPSQASATKTALAAWANINLAVNRSNKLNVVIDGASSDLGQGSDPTGGYGATGMGGYGYAEQLKDELASASVSWHNFAVGSATIANRARDYTDHFVQNSAFQAGSTGNILIAPGVSVFAELRANGGDAMATFADFKAWLAAAKSVAWTRIAVIAYPDAATAGMEAYNRLLFANQTSLGYDIIDGRTALQPLLTGQPYSNADGHPTVLGSSRYVAIIKPYLMRFL